MYEKYLLQLEEAGKIRNLKERSINCYKNYVSYFLNYMDKHPEELTCQDVRDFLLAKKDDGLKATTLNLYNSAIRFFYRNVLHVLWDDITVPRMIIEHKLPTVLSTDEIDLKLVYQLSEEQSVVGLVAAGIEHILDVKLPAEGVLQFVGYALQIEKQNSAMNSFIGVLVEKMRKEGIYTLLIVSVRNLGHSEF